MAKSQGTQRQIAPVQSSQKFTDSRLFRGTLLCLVFWLSALAYSQIPQWDVLLGKHRQSAPKCAQVEPLFPSLKSKELDDMEVYLTSDLFRNVAIERLSGAVRIPTQSYDDMGEIGEDARWDIFYSFANYLEKTYPLVHTTLQKEMVNTHGLLFTWAGTDRTLKPNLLMAHQDVVPVPDGTIKQWTHPPFSGHYDGTFIWGRGASDCKNQLLAILNAVEALIAAKFTPRRTLILSFGFDEEISGSKGAKHLSAHLLSKLGPHSIAAIIDEGAGIAESWGTNFALPGVTEKGYMDVNIVVRMPGGHSSIPPPHNAIGVASELITLIEANTYEPMLADTNPYLGLLQCGAEHAPSFPPKLGKILDKRSARTQTSSKKPSKDDLALEAAKAVPGLKYLFTTSMAVDTIHGGTKNNALPERTDITVNHRINIGSSSSAIKHHMAQLAARIAKKHKLTLYAFNGTGAANSITLSHSNPLLEPAPITPSTIFSSSSSSSSTTTINSKSTSPYAILAGTTRALYGTAIIVSPGLMTANTDTRFYWALSEDIFRYGPGWEREQVGLGNIHTVDERMGVRAHVDAVRWMVGWVRNVDEADLGL